MSTKKIKITTPQGSLTSKVNHPAHYNAHPAGIECIDIIEHFTFNIGSAVKYLWRNGLKETPRLEDLEKARWYIDREIQRVSKR